MTYNRIAMRLLFVADGRSPIAQNWIRHFVERGDEVYLASTFACSRMDFPLNGLEIVPVAFSALQKSDPAPRAPAPRGPWACVPRSGSGSVPITIRRASDRLRGFIETVKPDLVHAMRIPYEGMLAADAYTGIPLIVSIWGNDFTLHAPIHAADELLHTLDNASG